MIKKNAQPAEQKNPLACGIVESFEVNNVRMLKSGDVFFSLVLNGVTINNVRVVEGRNGDFIALPQFKGTNGKYYNTVWFKFSDDDTKEIIAELEKKLAEQ